MKVKANKVGFYGKLRKVDEEFEIENKKALGSWMEELKVKKAKAPAKAKVEANTEG